MYSVIKLLKMNKSTAKPETVEPNELNHTVDVKVQRKNKRKERLNLLRKEKHASVVQALWRGVLHRKSMKKMVQITQEVVSDIRQIKSNQSVSPQTVIPAYISEIDLNKSTNDLEGGNATIEKFHDYMEKR